LYVDIFFLHWFDQRAVVELLGVPRGPGPERPGGPAKHLIWEGTKGPLKGPPPWRPPMKSPVKFNTWLQHVILATMSMHRPGYIINW